MLLRACCLCCCLVGSTAANSAKHTTTYASVKLTAEHKVAKPTWAPTHAIDQFDISADLKMEAAGLEQTWTGGSDKAIANVRSERKVPTPWPTFAPTLSAGAIKLQVKAKKRLLAKQYHCPWDFIPSNIDASHSAAFAHLSTASMDPHLTNEEAQWSEELARILPSSPA